MLIIRAKLHSTDKFSDKTSTNLQKNNPNILALASVVDGSVLIDFGGGNTLSVQGLSDISALIDDISVA